MTHFTPYASLLGGALIGLAAAAMLLVNGKIAGISGMLGGVLQPRAGDTAWRVLFLGGLVAGGALMFLIQPGAFAMDLDRSLLAIAAAGVLVGAGTRLGNGCTSGHGVCGISRLSRRSIVATVTFIAAGAVTVLLVRVGFGGVL